MKRRLILILVGAAVLAVVLLAAAPSLKRSVPAFQRNMEALAAIEGIIPATVAALPTVDGLHLPGPDGADGFAAHLAGDASAPRDAGGIVMVAYSAAFVGEKYAGAHYAPQTIAATVLEFARYRTDPAAVSEIRKYLEFLLRYAEVGSGGNLLLPYRFDYPAVDARDPWYSAMSQTAAASAFLWGHRLTGDVRYREAAVSLALALETESGIGFLVPRGGGVWPKEYPTWRYSVLDGALAAVVGLWDLVRVLPADHPAAARISGLLERAKTGVIDGLPCFQSDAFGHFYADGAYSLGSGYQATNIRLLAYLAALDARFGVYAEDFSIAARGTLARAWHAAAITGRDFLVNRGLLPRNPEPCVRQP